MCKLLNAFLTAVTVLLIATTQSSAGIVYEQLIGADSVLAIVSSTLDNNGDPTELHVADNFKLANDATITELNWWGSQVSGGLDFRFIFYADDGGKPGAILHSSGGAVTFETKFTSPPGILITNFASRIDSPFVTTAGIKYWLSIYDQSPDANWLWRAAGIRGDLARSGSALAGDPWSVTRPDLAFQLIAVPEPTTLALAALGAFGLLIAARRKRMMLSRD